MNVSVNGRLHVPRVELVTQEKMNEFSCGNETDENSDPILILVLLVIRCSLNNS